MILRSEQFDDIYFSPQDGLAETTHVFLEGNALAERILENKNETDEFVIAETGFGTGLNFLAAMKLFLDKAPPDVGLHVISFEKYPLDKTQIKEALGTWDDVLGDLTETLCGHYPDDPKGSLTMALDPRVTLTLHFGDVNDLMPTTNFKADAWFLDGFKPSSNPDMWSETVFLEMARLSKPGATLATFTSAGFVRRGLQAAGFDIEKRPGFGRKREMITGRRA